ncbi:MAG: PilZ domain-containing protein [Deltaproteobacteria bacterium]|nr:PilZ domain-containing protein [Deltaproteobacteria bacterium]
MSDDRRRFSRFPASVPVRCKHRGDVETLLTEDVSRHGAFLLTDAPKPAGTLLQLTFDLPGGRAVESLCVVKRALGKDEPGGPGMGVDFFALEQDDKSAWEVFVAERDAAFTPPPPPEHAAVLTLHAPVESPPPMEDLPLPVPAEHARAAPTARASACFLLRLRDVDALRQFHARDVTQGITFIHTPVLRDPGERVEVVLIHPETDEEHRLPAQVAQAREDPAGDHGLSIRFDPLSEDAHVTLLTFIETGSDMLAPAPDPGEDRLRDLRRAVADTPDDAQAHLALGVHLLENRREPRAAVTTLLRALELDPALPDAHRRLHRAYIRLKDGKRAAAHLRVALALETVGWDAITEEGVKL